MQLGQSQSLETSDTARGSTVSAGGSVNITASGKGQDSDILIRGSDVSAGQNASLNAEGDVELLAAQNTVSLKGSNQSDSGSIGISFGTGGFGVSASARSARGNSARRARGLHGQHQRRRFFRPQALAHPALQVHPHLTHLSIQRRAQRAG